MTSHSFGTGWRFGPAPAGSDGPEFDDSGFAEVPFSVEVGSRAGRSPRRGYPSRSPDRAR
jgi:hypothetical protein